MWGWESDDFPARKLTEVKTRPTNQMAFAEGGRTLVTRHGSMMQVWDVRNDELVSRATFPEDQHQQFAIAPDGVTVATSCYGDIRLWDLKSELQTPSFKFACHEAVAVAFSPNGRLLAGSSQRNFKGEVQIVNVANGVTQKRLSFPGPVNQLSFTDDGRHLVTGNANGTIYVVRLEEAPKSSAE